MADFENILVKNTEEFIRKYFRNKLNKGLLMALLLLSVVFLVYNSVEFFAFLPGIVRKGMFFSFLGLFGFVIVFFVLIPLIKLLRYQQEMSLQQAARIIGNHFPEQVSDSLLNTLQLQNEWKKTRAEDGALLIEAIKQRTKSLGKISFVQAVDTSITARFFKVFVAVTFLFVLVLVTFPSFFKQPVKRIISYEADFQKPLPFEVFYSASHYEVLQNEDFTFQLEIKGEEIPAEFYISAGATNYQMEKVNVAERRFTFRKVTESLVFRIKGGDFMSPAIELIVRPKPLLLSYEANVAFPSYMKRSNEVLKDFTYVSLPLGSVLSWNLFSRNTDSILAVQDSLQFSVKVLNGTGSWNQTLLSNTSINYIAINDFQKDNDGIAIRLDVIEDEAPTILVDLSDSEALSKLHFFTGTITDDYGFTTLKAIVKNNSPDAKTVDLAATSLVIEKDVLRQQFYFGLNLDSLNFTESDNVEIFFEVTDNDAVKGPKTTRSNTYTLQAITKSLLDSVSEQKEDQLTKRLEQAMKESERVKNEMAAFNKDLIMKKAPDWSDQQKLKKLLERQQNLQNEIADIREQRKDLNSFNRDNDIQNERLLEKQAKIDALMEEIIPEDIKKMMDELQALLEEFNKDKVSELMKKMEMSQQEMEQLLDRNLSLLDQLKMEKDLTRLSERLNELAEKLEKNALNTLNETDSKEELLNNLEGLQKEFGQEKEKLDELKKQNQDLERPFDIENTDNAGEISKEMEEGSQQLSKGKKKESGQKQKSASDKMKQMSKQLMEMMQQEDDDQMEEDALALRFLLENLLRLSMSQEGLLNKLSKLKRDDPAYVTMIREQGSIAESFRVVEDSLTALGRRQPMIQNFVFGEVNLIKMRVAEAQNALKERNTGMALGAQQYSMMSINNLALMLAESLKNMQESMGMPSNAQGKGKGKGKKQSKEPGKSLQNMREMQEALGKQLKEAMKGNPGKGSKGGMSEELARMAAQQEALRGQLKQMLDGLKSEGQTGDNGLNKVLEQMEKFEEGLVNKRLNQQMMDLQNDIVVRLLESEKAQKERDQEERRESEEYKEKNSGNLESIPEYKKMLENQQEQLKTQPIDLMPFYKRLVNEYFIRSNVK